jgi:hypothetical protein
MTAHFHRAEVSAYFRASCSAWDMMGAMQQDEANARTTGDWAAAAPQENQELLELAQEAGNLGLF